MVQRKACLLQHPDAHKRQAAGRPAHPHAPLRYNLVENRICKRFVANLISVIIPWIVALAMYAGNLLSDVMNWGSLLTSVVLNQILAPYLLLSVGRLWRMARTCGVPICPTMLGHDDCPSSSCWG